MIVVSRWNELVTKELVEGAQDSLRAAGVSEIDVIWVPGTWEIPIVAAKVAGLGNVQGIVALGCILQGATNHAALLAGDVSSALMRIQLELGVPIAYGILTPENQEQALDRAGLKMGNKGREAAQALVETISVLNSIVEPAAKPKRR